MLKEHFHDPPAIRHVLKPRVYDPARAEPDFSSPVLLYSGPTSPAQRLLSNRVLEDIDFVHGRKEH